MSINIRYAFLVASGDDCYWLDWLCFLMSIFDNLEHKVVDAMQEFRG